MRILELIDHEIRTLDADLSEVQKGNSPEQPRQNAEATRLIQALNALHRIKTFALCDAIDEAAAHNHKQPLQLD